MEKAGLKSLFDISDLAIMGLAEVIPSITKVLRLIKQTVADIEKVKPDVVITIDSWSFGSRVQKILRRKKLGIPQVHYVGSDDKVIPPHLVAEFVGNNRQVFNVEGATHNHGWEKIYHNIWGDNAN